MFLWLITNIWKFYYNIKSWHSLEDGPIPWLFNYCVSDLKLVLLKKNFSHNCIKVAELYQSYHWLIFVHHIDMACLPLILMSCFPQVCCISSAISESLGSAIGKWFRIYEEICSLPSGNVHRMVIWQHGAEVDPYCWKYGVFFSTIAICWVILDIHLVSMHSSKDICFIQWICAEYTHTKTWSGKYSCAP